MPKIIKKQEVVLFEGITISDFLDKGFLGNLQKGGLEVLPAGLIFIVKDSKDGKKTEYPVILSHENEEEIRKKTLHISVPDPNQAVPEAFIRLLEGME